MWSVVTESPNIAVPSLLYIAEGTDIHGEISEKRRFLDVSRVRGPLIDLTYTRLDFIPQRFRFRELA